MEVRKKLFILSFIILVFTTNPLYAKSKIIKKVTEIVTDLLSIGASTIVIADGVKEYKSDNIASDSEKNTKEKTNIPSAKSDASITVSNNEKRNISDTSTKEDRLIAAELKKVALKKAKEKNHKDALKLYRKAFDFDMKNWKIWHGYGWSLLQSGMLLEAEKAYVIAIDLGGNEHTWMNLGQTFKQQVKINKAKICYKKSLSINRDNKQARNALDSIDKKILEKIKNDALSELSNESQTEILNNTAEKTEKEKNIPNNASTKNSSLKEKKHNIKLRDFIFDAAGLFYDGVAPVKDGELWGLLNKKGEWVVTPRYTNVGRYQEGRMAIRQNNMFAYIESSGNRITGFAYEDAHYFSEGLAGIKRGNKWGFINARGDLKIQAKFDSVRQFKDNLAAVRVNEK